MKLFKFKFSKFYILLIIIFSVLSAGLSITYPVIIGNLIDKLGINTTLINYFISLALIFIFLFISNFLSYDMVTKNEAKLLKVATSDNVLTVDPKEKDKLRAYIFKNMLLNLVED